ncbi:ubiquinol-cytochrome c reductase cytochrome c1 subunit [Dyella jiangningensis]|uniref:cytochrome c1 n=1 Tax=Dyella sp. AtDHG13 TaxID=1938897 RepID=UPI00087EDD2B|nr:cytochrome c1 [Dyella sp. AtDHG13]PXV58224.1 ubiquinol-cytochrome c reductase cytochrome c1 subunit [Dyella sp. AtDHG13]SDK11235.1 ubiquinol-cytochrome c reductase cytochrome c1 subunit [Dyella jiangningensis]
MTKRLFPMKKIFVSFALTVGLIAGVTSVAAAEEGGMPSAGTNIRDTASLQRGAKLFFNYCVGCHSLKYVRYSRMAEDLGLSEDEVMKNLNFTGAKFGDPVISHMPEDSAQQFFGKAPPDLSLEVRAKEQGPDWVFAYLNSFYVDPTRPVGWNNTVFPNASMPFPLWELQGIQTAVKKEGSDDVEKLELSQPGKLTPAQYQQATRDLTNFLEYASEPAALQRQRYGIWVLLFLAGFTFLAYLLKKEYWKDVH